MPRYPLIFLVLIAIYNDRVATSEAPPRFDVTEILQLESALVQLFGKMFKQQKTGVKNFELKIDNLSGIFDQTAKLIDVDDSKSAREIDNLKNVILEINNMYKEFRNCFNEEATNIAITKFMNSVISEIGEENLPKSIAEMRMLIYPKGSASTDKNIFQKISSVRHDNYTCGNALSPQAQLFELWKAIVITEIRGYIMSFFAWKTLEIIDKQSFQPQIDKVKENLDSSCETYRMLISTAMLTAPRDIRSCDPEYHIEGKTYFRQKAEYFYHPENIETVSMLEQRSEIDYNMVITGVKFELSGNMIHIQIKEGKLGPAGRIVNTTDKWRPLIATKREEKNEHYYVTIRHKVRLREKKDWAYIHLGGVINLDDITVPEGYVVTGVKLAFKEENIPFHFQIFSLQVQATQFDFVTGKLIFSNNNPPIWINSTMLNPVPEVYKRKRIQLKAFYPDNPVKASNNSVDAVGNQFFILRMTNQVLDKSNLTIPFFDAQPCEMEPGFPLGGIGLTHKGEEGFGGFFTFKLYTLDLSQYIQKN